MEIFTALMFGYCAYIMPPDPHGIDTVALGKVHHYAHGNVCEAEWYIGDKPVYLVGDHVITIAWRGVGQASMFRNEDRRDAILFFDDMRFEIRHHTGA